MLLALAFCVPAYGLALWLGRKPLMLDVLRGLIRTRSRSTVEDPVTEPDAEA